MTTTTASGLKLPDGEEYRRDPLHMHTGTGLRSLALLLFSILAGSITAGCAARPATAETDTQSAKRQQIIQKHKDAADNGQ